MPEFPHDELQNASRNLYTLCRVRLKHTEIICSSLPCLLAVFSYEVVSQQTLIRESAHCGEILHCSCEAIYCRKQQVSLPGK